MVSQSHRLLSFLTADELAAIQGQTGAEDGDAVFFGTDVRVTVNKVLGRLRSEFADHFKAQRSIESGSLLDCWDSLFMNTTNQLAKLTLGIIRLVCRVVAWKRCELLIPMRKSYDCRRPV